MKKYSLLLLLNTLLMSSFAFEGVVSIQYKGKAEAKEEFNMTWYLTPAKARLDVLYTGEKSTGKASVFIPSTDPKKVLIYTANPASAEEKKYFNASVDKVPVLDDYKTTTTGETKTIGGVKCTKYTFKSATSTITSWIAKDLDINWNNYAFTFRTITELQIMAANGLKGFPLESETKNDAGETTSKYTLNFLKQEKVDANTFALPEGYTVFGSK